jgi:HSP20 family protein
MNSFLRKLKREGVVKQEEPAASLPTTPNTRSNAVPAGVLQLPVDVYQEDSRIIIFAQSPGLEISNLDVSIEGENDVVTIQGEYKRPMHLIGEDPTKKATGEFSLEECSWGQFFRQIILPHEVDTNAAEAKTKDGILIVILPIKNAAVKKIKMHVEKIKEEEPHP